MKWLVAMRAFQAVVDPYLVPCGSQPVVPCGLQPVVQPPEVILATGIMEAVRACNGDAMEEMYRKLTRRSGQAGIHSGLIWVLRRLGFIDDDDDDDDNAGAVKKRPAGPPTHKRHTHKRPRGSAGARRQGGERGDAAPSQDQGGVDQLECQLGAMQETY